MDHLPKNIWQLIVAWTEQQKTGQIILNMNQGKVVNAETKEKVQSILT